MEGQSIGLKRRIGILVTAVIVATSLLAAPAQANSLGQYCERHKNGNNAQKQCCQNRANSNSQKNKCIKYVRSH
jgi:hypothetical protein